jgi:glutathione S-transferase
MAGWTRDLSACSPSPGGQHSSLGERLAWVDTQRAGRDGLMRDTFTVADTGLFKAANWSRLAGVNIAPLAHLSASMARVAARPAAARRGRRHQAAASFFGAGLSRSLHAAR